MLYIECRAPGVLMVNGQFCGPLEGEGQAFPLGRNAEAYIQFFPFGRGAPPLTAAMRMQDGRIERLEPEDAVCALLWPDGTVQLELTPPQTDGSCPQAEDGGAEGASSASLMRYLCARLAGDPQAGGMLLRPQDGPDLSGYAAVVPLRWPPVSAPERYDERAGLVARLAPNIARVDAALAATVPSGQGRRMIERILLLADGAKG